MLSKLTSPSFLTALLSRPAIGRVVLALYAQFAVADARLSSASVEPQAVMASPRRGAPAGSGQVAWWLLRTLPSLQRSGSMSMDSFG